MEDTSLIVLIAQGDQSAAESFDTRFRPTLVRFLQGRVHPDHQQDLTQETLIAAFQAIKRGDFCGRSSIGTWLIGILKHKLADYWNDQQRARNMFVHTSAPPLLATGSNVDTVADSSCDPSIRIAVDQSLQKLPKLHRAILLLHLRERFTTEEIAAATKLRPGTVGRVLWEAKRMLRHHLELKKPPSVND